MKPVAQRDLARLRPRCHALRDNRRLLRTLQRRRRGVPVRTSTRRKLCPSIGKLLGTRSPCSIKTTAAGSHHCRRPPQGGDQAPLTNLERVFWDDRTGYLIEVDGMFVRADDLPEALGHEPRGIAA